MTEELKACPFCGSKRITEVVISEYHSFCCCECHATGMVMGASAKFVDVMRAWNNRPIEDALTAENKKLRDLLDKLLDEYSFMSDRYWDGIYPSTPSKEMSDKHKEIVKAIREALK